MGAGGRPRVLIGGQTFEICDGDGAGMEQYVKEVAEEGPRFTVPPGMAIDDAALQIALETVLRGHAHRVLSTRLRRVGRRDSLEEAVEVSSLLRDARSLEDKLVMLRLVTLMARRELRRQFPPPEPPSGRETRQLTVMRDGAGRMTGATLVKETQPPAA